MVKFMIKKEKSKTFLLHIKIGGKKVILMNSDTT
jgi:hypothetical protein